MAFVCKLTDTNGVTGPVASGIYGKCETAAGTATKVVTLADFDKLITGVTIHVKFTNSNTATNPTLNVNGTGAKNIYRYGTTVPSTSASWSWYAGSVVSFTYDGSAWIMNDMIGNDDTKNTAGSTDTSSKIFLIGATSQAANPQTYSDNEVYTTSGVLTTKKVQVGGGSCTMEYNTTTESLDFVFS